jgi:hypothetical protein
MRWYTVTAICLCANSIFKGNVALVTELEEPYEGRSSRTVLWEREGEIPSRDPTVS